MYIGQNPYDGMSCQEAAMFVCFRQGRLEIPKDCPQILYNVLLSCWNSNVESRPNFDTLCLIFEQLSADTSLLERNSTDFSNLLKLGAEETNNFPLIKATINEEEKQQRDSLKQTCNTNEIKEGTTLSSQSSM